MSHSRHSGLHHWKSEERPLANTVHQSYPNIISCLLLFLESSEHQVDNRPPYYWTCLNIKRAWPIINSLTSSPRLVWYSTWIEQRISETRLWQYLTSDVWKPKPLAVGICLIIRAGVNNGSLWMMHPPHDESVLSYSKNAWTMYYSCHGNTQQGGPVRLLKRCIKDVLTHSLLNTWT